jgi:hypothetical protein
MSLQQGPRRRQPIRSNSFHLFREGGLPIWSRRIRMKATVYSCLRVVVIALLMIAVPEAFSKSGQVRQTIYADGQPARHVLVSLYKCGDGSLYAGPFATSTDGSVTFPSVEDGEYCERTDIPAGFASKKVVVDTTIQNQRIDVSESIPTLTWTDRVVPAAFCLFSLLLVVYPIARYLAKPWTFRRDTLTGQLSGSPMKLYYQQFRGGELIPNVSSGKKPVEQKPVGDSALSVSDYEQAFVAQFDKWYGRHYYIAPVCGLAVLTAICAWWGTVNLWLWISGLRDIESLYGLAGAAIAGAIVWIISDEIDRLRRRDFTTSDVYYYIFRLLLAVPFAWALTRVEITLQLGIPIAFFLGAFPTSTLFTAARRIVNQRLKLGDDPSSGNLELEKLKTVGKESAERFKDEGISTVSQLAYADPVDLTIRTNFDFNYITDCISQALLWIYFGDQAEALAIYSLRGAFEANSLVQDLNSGSARAKQTIADVVALLAANNIQISGDALQTTLEQIADDPYTLFLVDIWK